MSGRPLSASNLDGRISVPQGQGEIVSVPALSSGAELARRNQSALTHSNVRIFGTPLTEFRNRAREECLVTAAKWMDCVLGIKAPSVQGSLFVTGHQPLPTHPGVWMKNVAVDALAQSVSGTGLNLIVDNDLAVSQAVHVPGGTRQQPAFDDLFFDAIQSRQPWEEVQLQDRPLFASFADRAIQALQPWGIEPLAPQIWQEAVRTLEKSNRTADLLSAARVSQEQRWNMRNLELPVSELCCTDSFLEFVAHIAAEPQRFLSIHNQAVAEYRLRNRIRNRRHPVPDLQVQEDRYELPFWFYRPGDRDRTRVFARVNAGVTEIHAANTLLTKLVPGEELAALRELQRTGRLRTRALTTTLFARLCVADLFIHGIGGARYDEITNVIIQRYFNIAAPEFLTLTATLNLPLEPFSVDQATVRSLRHQIRDFKYNAERFLANSPIDKLRTRKQQLIAASKAVQTARRPKSEWNLTRPERRERHLELRQIEADLAQQAQHERDRVQQHLERVSQELRANAVLTSRDFPALLFPESMLTDLVQRVRSRAD